MLPKLPKKATKGINIALPILLFILGVTAIALIAQIIKIMKPLKDVNDPQYLHFGNDIVGLWHLNTTAQVALAPINWIMTSSHIILVIGVLSLAVGLVSGATGVLGQIDNGEAAVMMMAGICAIGSFVAVVVSFVQAGKDPTNWFKYGLLEDRVNNWAEGKNLTSVVDYQALQAQVNTWVRGANVTVEGWSCLMKMQPFDAVDVGKFDKVCKDSQAARFLTIPLFLVSLLFFVVAVGAWISRPSKREKLAPPMAAINGSPARQPAVAKSEGTV